MDSLVSPDDGKLHHHAVSYDIGMKSAHCSLCRYYVGPDTCVLVENVKASGWCELFTKVREES